MVGKHLSYRQKQLVKTVREAMVAMSTTLSSQALWKDLHQKDWAEANKWYESFEAELRKRQKSNDGELVQLSVDFDLLVEHAEMINKNLSSILENVDQQRFGVAYNSVEKLQNLRLFIDAMDVQEALKS